MPTTVRRPTHRRISYKTLVYAAAGPELPYPVYQFSNGKTRVEKPKHNPFRGL